MAEPGVTDVRPENDIYTVLVVLAAIFLIAGTVYVSVRAQALFDHWLPF